VSDDPTTASIEDRNDELARLRAENLRLSRALDAARTEVEVMRADRDRLVAARRVEANDPSSLVGEAAYLSLLRRILGHGASRTDRTGTGTYSIFGAQLRFDLRQGFPLITTKRVPFSSVIKELLWFLRGSTNVRDLDTPIWNEWADENGELGPIYGHQWRRWGAGAVVSSQGDVDLLTGTVKFRIDAARGIDQIQGAIEAIKTNPDSRRIVVSAWNVADLPQMRLPPCHLLFQLYVDGGHLDLQLYQRSADMALGVPFNIASYALLLSMIATECRLVPRYFVHTLGDAHVYANHVEGIRLQLSRALLPPPRLQLSDKRVLEQTPDDVRLVDYQHYPAIRFEIAV
jgi:thymidylate synthase